MSTTHPSFEVISKDIVKEYGAYCVMYKHKKSGAQVLSVAADDDNKVFGITFRTPPKDSTGVAHILEHSVLCGSRKYPTKEPFVELIKGSLNTFLNAFTYPDRTCYPVASQNTKDFYNLVNVYLDAVLHPRATSDPMVHAQEGWHLELEDKADELTYKGVVYNEMKGVYSSPDSLLGRESQRSLFPDNAYGVDSGGDPRVIPDLSFEDFRDFHRSKYDPSNSRIFFYGDDDVGKRLELLDEYLKDFEERNENTEVKWQMKSFLSPKREKHPYPTTPDQPQTHMVNVNWLLNDSPLSDVELLALNVLDHLLLSTPSSVLRKTLMESGLGDSITGGGLSDELLQATFSIGLKGIDPKNVEKTEDLILETIAKITQEGFEDDAVKASMNSIEFQLREFNTGSFPRGLSLMLGSMSNWIYERDPTENIKFEKALEGLKEDLDARGSDVFTDLLKKFLINNTHRSTIEMIPDTTLEEKQVLEEKKKLASIKDKMTDDELDDIIEKTAELKRLQAKEDSPEAIATIPSLTLSDLDKDVKEYPIEVTPNYADTGITAVTNKMVSTSGILYATLAVDVSDVKLEDVPLIPLFTRVMMETGAGEFDDVALSRRIGTYTGGVSVRMGTNGVMEEDVEDDLIGDGSKFSSKIFIKGKATADNTDKLLEIFNLVLTESNLDSQAKIIEMLKETKSRVESSIQGSGHTYANSRLLSRYTVNGFISEQTAGITYLASVKKYLAMAEDDFPALLAKLEGIRTTILKSEKCRDGMILNLVADEDVLSESKDEVDKFLTNLPGDAKPSEKFVNFYKEEHPWATQAKKLMGDVKNEGFVVSTQVNYVGQGARLYDVGEKMRGSAAVIARHLRTGYLWDTVRVIGGAYGGFCTLTGNTGIFTFLSYRDPNFVGSFEAYEKAADALMEQAENLTEEQLATAIIGTVGDLDSALSVDAKGATQFARWLANESPETRQKHRDEILATSKEDFIEFAKRMKERLTREKMSTAVITSKGGVEEAIKQGREMEVVEVL